jgi:multicomponent K+:H+ antiporter subunit E
MKSNLPSSNTTRARWFSHPVLSVLLAASWLALSHSLAPVHLLSALLIALIVPRVLHPFLGEAARVDWLAAIRLSIVVLHDVVASNITVAKLVLGPLPRMKPAWLPVPLACDHPKVNALFATIITTTPGTVSCVVDEQAHQILVHALNCDDPQAMIDDMKQRYEAPLLKIFGQSPRAQVDANVAATETFVISNGTKS